MDIRFEAFMANKCVKSSQAISHVIVELKNSVSEIFLFSASLQSMMETKDMAECCRKF
jgi:hypothetical protein